jgi:diketogulonate reductase-like aldo/keto reductase
MEGEVGLGTYNMLGQECTRAVLEAFEIGYRLIDTASVYGNHEPIGIALREIDRSDIRIVSKIWIQDEVDDADLDGSIRSSLDRCLNELKTDYLDIYLIHWPDRQRDLEGMLKVMDTLKEEGKICEIGVSNFTEHHLQDAYDAGISVAWNQVELHPMLTQKRLVDFSRQHGTQTMSYRPFCKGDLLNKDPLFAKIGERYDKTGGQVILRWITQQGITVTPKAALKSHLLENFQASNFTLKQDEMDALDELNLNLRTCDKEFSEFDY